MRRRTTFILVLALSAVAARGEDPKVEYSIGEPSDEEQLLLELVNRARLDPAGEADRLFTDYGSAWVKTNVDTFAAQIPQSWTRAENRTAWRSYAPRPALAPNRRLLTMSHEWSLAMRGKDTVAQTFPDQLSLIARADRVGYSSLWLAQLLQGGTPDMLGAHASWTIDWGQPVLPGVGRPGFPNRLAVINPGNVQVLDFHEAAPGVVRRDNPPPGGLGPRIVTLTLGASANSTERFVTGVVYDDRDGDNFYDPGEGVGGVRIDVDRSSYYCLTAPSGGYAVPVSGTAGNVTITASGVAGRASELFRRQTLTGNTLAFGQPGNVKADFLARPREPAPAVTSFDGTTGAMAPGGDQTFVCSVSSFDPTRPTVGDVDVDIDLAHPDRSRLRLTLTAPDDTAVVLWEGGPGGADLRGSFDRTLSPREPLAAFVDRPYTGTWRLRVQDAADAQTVVRSWSLRLRPRWEGPLHAPHPALFVRRLQIADKAKPLSDKLKLRAEIDVGDVLDDTAAARLAVILTAAEAPFTELLRIPLAGDVGASSVVLSGGSVTHTFDPSPRGTSRAKLAVNVTGVDLPDLPRELRLVVAVGDAVVGETIRTQRGRFRGARTAPSGGTLHLDRVTSRMHVLGRRTDIRGRLLLRGAPPVPGVLEVRVGAASAVWLKGPLAERAGSLLYARNGAVSRFAIDPATGQFVLRVVGSDAVLDADGRIPIAIWAAEDFQAVEVVPRTEADGTLRY